MFFTGVCDSAHRGLSVADSPRADIPLGRNPGQTPPQADTPLWQTPSDRQPPGQTLPGRHPLQIPPGRHPGQRPPRQTPSLGRNPPQTPPTDTPPGQTPPEMATAADGMHPTGIHSCKTYFYLKIRTSCGAKAGKCINCVFPQFMFSGIPTIN